MSASLETMPQPFFRISKPAWLSSLCLHIAIPLFFVTIDALDSNGFFSSKKKKNSELYQEYIQVDVVALPDALINERKNTDTSLPIVDQPKVAVDPAPEDTAESDLDLPDNMATQAQKAAAEKERIVKERAAKEKARLDEQDKAMSRLKEDAAREAALKSLANKDGKIGRERVSGNILSKGTSLTGRIGSAKEQYESRVIQAIREHFIVYAWQKKKNPVTVLHMEIFPNGRIRERKIVKKSTDNRFDNMVLSAVDQAQPLPIPDDPALVSDGITVELTP